jgi:hypothetical protein
MNDTAKWFFSDARIYLCFLTGCVGLLLPSRLLLERWPFYGRLSSKQVSLALPFMMLPIAILFAPMSFDWSGELALESLNFKI